MYYLMIAVLMYFCAWCIAEGLRGIEKKAETRFTESQLKVSALMQVKKSTEEVGLDLRFLDKVDDASLKLYYLLTLGYPLGYDGAVTVKESEPVYDFYSSKEPQIAEIIDRIIEGARAIKEMSEETLSSHTFSELREIVISREDAEILGSARKARWCLENCYREMIHGKITPRKMNRKARKIIKAAGGRYKY